MIEFPRKLHNLHYFKRNDEPFVADLDAGVVIPVNEVICDVLNACETLETDTIIDTRADKHNRSDIFDALAFLTKLSKNGVLFSSEPSGIEALHRNERPKIYVTPGVFESRETTPFLLSAANHELITRLTDHADVYLGLSEMDNNRQEIEESLRAEGVHPIFFKSNRTFSPAKSIPKDCDGILALSPLTEGEQVFGKFNTIPVIMRLSNAALMPYGARNTVLERGAGLKHFDAIACDASWTQTFFSEVVAEMCPFHHIPYGIDTAVFKPMDKTACKHQVSQALGTPAGIQQKPLVGVVPGLPTHETLGFMRKLQSANPKVNYLVIHSSVRDDFTKEGGVNFFNLASQQDKAASPFIFNALDALVFPTILGTSPLLLLEIVACGIPTIVWGYAVPEEISGAGFRFVQVSPSLFNSVQLPVESISRELKLLLENPDEQRRLGQAGLESVSVYTWNAAIQGILTLFRDLRHRRANPPKQRNHKLLFRKHYNGVSGEIESDALVQSKLPTPIGVEQAIATTLLEEQTPMEVKTVLASICRDPDRVENILKNLL